MQCWSSGRLVLAFMLCAASSLAVFQAPVIAVFPVGLVATELGHWFFLAPLLVALLPASRSFAGRAGTAIALAACGLLISSVVRAQWVVAKLPAEMARVFSTTEDPARTPFSWKQLWFAPRDETMTADILEYSHLTGIPLKLRLYRCATRAPAPCILMVHGGGWNSGSPDEFPALQRHMARNGYVVAAPEYRLSPASPWPAQREDVLAALRWLKEHAGEYGIDPQRFVLMGHSAGGQIAEAVAYGAHDPAIRGCIAFYSPADLHYAYEFARADDILNSLKLVKEYMGGTPTEVRSNYDSASGILLADASSPPTLLLHGRRDELVWFRQSERLNQRLQELGVRHYFVRLPWATHAFDHTLNGPGGQIAVYAVDTFLNSVTR